MSAVDRDTLTVLAGEYVLGTLRGRAREEFEALCAADPDVAAVRDAWEDHLAPLAALYPRVVPPEHLWTHLSEDLGFEVISDRRSADRGAVDIEDLLIEETEAQTAEIIDLRRSLGRWRVTSVMMGMAVAAGLVGVVLVRPDLLPVPPPVPAPVVVAEKPAESAPHVSNHAPAAPARPMLVAVMLNEAQEPWCVVREGAPDGKLTLTLMKPMPDDGLDRELWIIGPDNVPKSLGLIAQDGLSIDPAVETGPGRTLAVSREPKGGSPTGTPTGPVFATGKLVKVMDL